LAQVCRPGRRGGRHRPVRRIGARRKALRIFRLHRGQRREGRQKCFALRKSLRSSRMAIKVAINGYGRIGRNILRAHYEGGKKHDIEIVALNDLGDARINAHLTRYDTVHGRFGGTVKVDGDALIVNGDRIRVLSTRDPSQLPWAAMGVDVVHECTGLFTTKERAGAHLQAGAKKVIISAPGGKDVDATIVIGVNDATLRKEHTVISNASCT